MHDPNPEQATDFPLFASTVDHGKADYVRNSFGKIHWHDDLQFITIDSGSIAVVTPEQSFNLTAGDVLFLNSRTPHLIKSKATGTYSYILVPAKMLGFFPGSRMAAERVIPYTAAGCDAAICLDGSEEWHGQVLELVHESRDAIDAAHAGTGSAYAAALKATELWFEFTEHASFSRLGGGDDRTSERLREFIAFVQEHYAEDISVEDIAAAGSVSKVECGRVFRKAFATTPHRFLTDYRIDRACDLLRAGEMSVTEVGISCGFGSASHFATAFKKALGTSPREFRKNA